MRWLAMLTICILFLLTGCLYGPVSKRAAVGASGGEITVESWASTNCAKLGETVNLHTRLTNSSSNTFSVEMNDRPVFDLCIEGFGGYKKCWSDGKPLTPDVTRIELKPGQSKDLEMKWIAEYSSEFGAGGSFYYGSNSRFISGAILVVGVEGNCTFEKVR